MNVLMFIFLLFFSYLCVYTDTWRLSNWTDFKFCGDSFISLVGSQGAKVICVEPPPKSKAAKVFAGLPNNLSKKMEYITTIITTGTVKYKVVN